MAAPFPTTGQRAVKGFVIRQLQVCGGIEQASAIANFLADPDDHIYEYAAQALEAIGPETVIHFRKTYSQAKGPAPDHPARLGRTQGQGFQGCLSERDQGRDLEIRLAGLWGLMRIASAEDADLLLTQSAKESGWGRIKATAYCLELAETLRKTEKKESRAIYLNIKKTRTQEHEDYLRESADRGLSV